MTGRTLRRWLLAGAAIFGVLVVLLAGAAAWLLRTDSGRATLAGLIVEAARVPGEQEIVIGRLEGALPGEIVLHDVTVADRDGAWLTLADARLEWRPWALLGRAVDIEALTVDGLSVLRAPAGPATEPAGPPSPLPREIALPPLSVDVRLARFDLDRVSLGPDMLGEAVALRASGRFGVDALGDARGRVRVERTDGAALEAALDAELNSSKGTLTLDLDVAEPPGGIVARLADLPDLPAVSLSLKGSGPADAWQGRLAAEAAGKAALNADVAIALGERPTLGLVGSADISGLADADLLMLVGPVPQFDIVMARGSESLLTLDRLTLTGAAVEATATGSLDLDASSLDMRATAYLLDVAVIGHFAEGIAAGDARIEAHVTGPTDALAVTAKAVFTDLAADGVTVGRVAADVDGALWPSALGGDVRLDLNAIAAADPALAALPARLTARARIDVDLAGQTAMLSDLAVSGDGVAVAGAGRVGLADGAVALDAKATLDRLKPLAALAGVALDGRLEATMALTGSAFGERSGGTLEIALRDLASPYLPLGPTVGRTATLRATVVELSASGVTVPEFVLAGTNLRARGKLAIHDDWQAIDLAATLGEHRLAPWQDVAGIALAGTLRGTLVLDGALADPRARVALDLADAGVEGIGPLAGRVTVNAQTLASAPAGDVAVTFYSPAGPVSAATRFALAAGERLKLDGIALDVAGAHAGGSLALALASGLADGRLDLAADDLAPLGRLAGQELAGAATGRIELAGKAGAQTGAVSLNVPNLTLSSAGGEPLALTGLAATARLDGLTPQPTLAARLSVATLRSGATRFDTLEMTADGTPASLAVTAKASGVLPAPLTLALAGTIGQRGEAWTATLDRLDGALAVTPIALRRPVSVAVAPTALRLSPLDLGVGDGRITGEATLDAGRVSARLDVAGLPAALLAALAADGTRLSGTLELQAALDGAADNPSGTLGLQLDGIALRDTGLPDSVTLGGEATARLADGRLALRAEIGGFAEQGMALDAALPLRLSLQPFAAALPPDGAIAGTLDWQGEVATLWEELPFDSHRLAGRADIAVRAEGSVAEPVVTGRFRLDGGRYENLDLGTVLNRLAIAADVDRGRHLTVTLSGTDGGKGTLNGSGSVALDPLEGFPTQVDLTFADATLVRRDELALAAGGTLALAGDADAMKVTGTVETTRIEANLDSALPPSVVELEVVDSKPAAAAEAAEPPAAKPGALTLDVGIVVPGQAFVRGRGLDSEWRGDLRVTGDAAAPAIAGTLSFVRGQFTFAGKRFTLDDSTITFDGSTKVDPLLDIRAANDAGDVTALILITGRASDPKIALSATPPLPQDEVLSRVLFGKSAGSLSPLEALQLAAAVAQLSGQGPSGPGILDKVRNTLGVDVLEVGAGDDGNGASLRAGRYIDERTFVGVTQGTQPGSTGVTVEIELTPNVVIDTRVDQAGATKSGVKWKWDY